MADPDSGDNIVLLRADAFAEILQEERTRKAIAVVAARNAAARTEEP